MRLLLASRVAVLALAFLIGLAALSALAPLLAPADPELVNPAVRLRGPSPEHWLGTDDLGRDVLSRLLYGGRISLLVGAAVTLVAVVLGAALGLLAGYWSWLDGPIMRVLDGIMAFPGVLLAIAIVVSLGPGLGSVIIALALVYTPVVARLIRSTTLVIKQMPYVEAARCIGLPHRVILWRYVLANSVSPLIVQATFIVAYAILAEASLSFLGASGNPEAATWGAMLRDGQRLVSRAWWLALAPGTVLFLTVFALNLVGDVLRDALDPRAHERREDAPVQ
ncbi:MAG: ABC transporter permease [Sphaerobacter sp.]|nr:ABC transporter permease [Sphaerobacter sp.]MDI3341381.1 ABC transporter permease [Sphaerobacter sp.]